MEDRKHSFQVGDKVVIYATVKSQVDIDKMVRSITSEREVFGMDISAISRCDLVEKSVKKKYEKHRETISDILSGLESEELELL